MQLILTPGESVFLYRILFNPYAFPLTHVRVAGQPLLPWRPRGEGKEALRVAKQIHALKKWFNLHVATEVSEKFGKIEHQFGTSDIQVGLTQVYIDLLLDLIEYYEPIGCLAEYVDVYLPLIGKLKDEKYMIEDPFVAPESESTPKSEPK
jgi:hypothetical protein